MEQNGPFDEIIEGGGRYFTIGSYGNVRFKNFCKDPIPEYR